MSMLMHPEAVASLPIWLAGILMASFAVGGAVVVELIARRLVPLSLRQENAAVASAMFTVIGTTYAVLLAFVAMLAWDGFNKAQAVVDAEAALAERLVEIADGIQGPEKDAVRSDIVAYVRAVVSAEWPTQMVGGPVRDDEPHLRHLTSVALHLRADAIADQEVRALLLRDVVGLGAARQERLSAARALLPGIIWFVLLAGGGVTVAFGSFLGASSLAMHLAMSSLLAVSGALVLLVIVALSNPFRGDFRVSPEPFERVLALGL
jgi:hypothetical protein